MDGALEHRVLTAPASRELRPSRVRRLRARMRDDRGTAVVEFAIVAMPLFLIIFGVIDFGRALNYYNDLTQIAGQGARAAAVNANPNGAAAGTDFQHQLACYGTTAELRGRMNVQITTMPSTTSPNGTPVAVKTSYSFHFIPLISSVNVTLSSTQTERYESTLPPGYAQSGDVTNGSGTSTC